MTLLNYKGSRKVMRLIALVCLVVAGSLLQPIAAKAQPGGKLVNIDNVRIGFITGPSEPGDPGDLKNRLSYFKPGAWTPVFVDITAGLQGLENATLSVETTDNDDIQNTYTVPLPRLDPKESIQAITYVKPGSGGGDIIITVNKGNQSAKHTRTFSQLDHLNLNELLYLTAGARLPGLRRLANTITEESQKQNSPRAQFYQPRSAYVDDADQLPTRWFGYDSVDLLILSTGNKDFTEKLLGDRNRRKEAIVEWVERGGHLIISTGKHQDMVRELVERMGIPLTVKITGSRPVDRLSEVENWCGAQVPLQSQTTKDGKKPTFDLAKLSRVSKEADVLLALKSDGSPLIVRMPFGLGQVTLVGFDLDQQPFASWPGQSQFWEKLLTETHHLTRDPSHRNQNNPNMNPFGVEDNGEVAGDLQYSLEQFDDVPMISFGWVALFILIYIVVVGPLDYLFLKKVVKRLELTWITFPTVVLVVSAVAYFTAYAIKGNDLRINKVDLVDIDLVEGQGKARSYGQTWFTLFSPRIQLYTIGIEPGTPIWAAAPAEGKPSASVLVSWMGRPDSNFGGYDRPRSQSLFRRSYEYAPDGSGLLGVPIQVWSSKSFTARWEAPLDPNHMPFRVDLRHPADAENPKGNPKDLTGSITNLLPFALLEATLIYGDGDAMPHTFPLGRLEANETKQIDIHRNQGGNDLSLWAPASTQRNWQYGRFGRTAQGSAGPVLDSLKKAMFHDASQLEIFRNNSIRHLDQKWRLTKHADEAVLFFRLPASKGEAEKINRAPETPTQLWLGELPSSGKERPNLWGNLKQESFVRVFIPVKGP
jgi:hypothetical protein